MTEHKTRKKNRLKEYDYSSTGMYFVTVCTNNKEKYFRNCENTEGFPELSHVGKIVESGIQNIESVYENVELMKYCIMPDHVHILLFIYSVESQISLQRIVKQLKGYVTKNVGFSVWQKSFHDHIVRNQHDFDEICDYIDNNPNKWEEKMGIK